MLNIKKTNFELTPALDAYLQKRLRKVKKFIELNHENTVIQIELEKEATHNKGDVYRAEINAEVSGEMFRSEEKKSDMRTAIDAAVNEILKQIRRTKGKKETLLRRGGARIKHLLKFKK